MQNTGKERCLTPGEIELARTVFGNNIDYAKTRISNRQLNKMAPKNGGCCFKNCINISGASYLEDYSKAAPPKQSFFIHEMTHIWQYQTNAFALARGFLKDMVRHGFNYMAKAYDYRLEASKIFSEYGPEQQAGMVQDYFLLLNGYTTPRCQNENLSVSDKSALYRKILAPDFPIASQPESNRNTNKTFKP
jgi:hypothetical protein